MSRTPARFAAKKVEYRGGACPVVKTAFHKSVNMSADAIRKWARDPRAKCGSFDETIERLTKPQFWKAAGIMQPPLARLKAKARGAWTATDCIYAERVINFNTRMQGNVDAHGCGVRNVVSLLNWGRRPKCPLPPANCSTRAPRGGKRKR